MFFVSFFVSFLTIAETSFPPHARSSSPHLSTVPCPSSLASPTAAIASFIGTQVKICLFLFFFFCSFSDQCYRDPLPHMPGSQTPTSPPHNLHPHPLPLKPHKSPLPLPHHMQAMTSASPLHHTQVHCHHPVMACKTCHNTALTPSQHSVQA